MNEFQLIAAMLEDLNIRIEALEADDEGRRTDGTKFRELLGRFQVFLGRVQVFMEQFRSQTPGPKPMTMEEAFKITAEKLGPIKPILRCWPNKDGYRCAIGIGGAGRGHVVLAGGSTWEQAVNALDTYLAGPKYETCNICGNPDCENPNQKH